MKNKMLFLIILVFIITSCKKNKQGVNDVYMKDSAYSPSVLTISKGTTVIWTNKENVLHTVTSDSSNIFNSGDMGKNKSFSYTFSVVGQFPYHCKYHSFMTGTIIVQ